MEASGPARVGAGRTLVEQIQQPTMGSALGWILPSGVTISLGVMTLTGPVGGSGFAAATLNSSVSAGQFAQGSFNVVSDALAGGVTFSLRNSSTSATTVLVTTAGLLGSFGFSGLVGGTGTYDQLTVALVSNTLLNIGVVAQASLLA